MSQLSDMAGRSGCGDLLFGIVERTLDNSGTVRTGLGHDLNLRPDHRRIRRDHGQRDVLPEPRRIDCGRDLTDGFPALVDRPEGGVGPGKRIAIYDQADLFTADALLL